MFLTLKENQFTYDFQGHRRVSHEFYKLILLKRVFTKLQVAFYHLKNSNKFLIYIQSKLGGITDSLWEEKPKTAKKTFLFEIYLLLHFLSNLHQIFTF